MVHANTAELPAIPGYRVWRGRRLLHARHEGSYAQAHRAGQPWHVVAETSTGLVDQVTGRTTGGRFRASAGGR